MCSSITELFFEFSLNIDPEFRCLMREPMDIDLHGQVTSDREYSLLLSKNAAMTR